MDFSSHGETRTGDVYSYSNPGCSRYKYPLIGLGLVAGAAAASLFWPEISDVVNQLWKHISDAYEINAIYQPSYFNPYV